MKKILLMLILTIPFNVRCLSASSYIVMDMDSGRIIYEKNANEKMYPASMTKMMGLILILEKIEHQ